MVVPGVLGLFESSPTEHLRIDCEANTTRYVSEGRLIPRSHVGLRFPR